MKIKKNNNNENIVQKGEESGNPYFDINYQPQPEDFAADPERAPHPRPLRTVPPFRYALPGLLIYVFFIVASYIYWYSPYGEYLWASRFAVFNRLEIWRLVTALFVHSNLQHLLSNGPLFLIFSYYLRAYYGPVVFPASALVIGSLTNAVTLLNYGAQTRLIGASGMVYAIVAIWLVLYIRFNEEYRVGIRIFRAAGFSLIMMFPTTFSPQTSYTAHAAGFILGIIGSLVMFPFINVRTFIKKTGNGENTVGSRLRD